LGDLGGVGGQVDLVQEALLVQKTRVLLDLGLVPVPRPLVLVLPNVGVVGALVLGLADDGGAEACHLRLLPLLPMAVLEMLRVLRKTPLLHIGLLGDVVVVYC